jgi:hypothetical protein
MDPNRTFAAHRRRLAGVVIVGAASATMLLGPAGVATAADCPIADLSCLHNQLDDAQQTADDTVSGAQDDAATVVSTVGGVTDPVGQPPGGDGPGAHHGGGVGHHPGGSATGHVRPSGSVPTVLTREGGTVTQIGTAINGEADASPTDHTDQDPAATGLGEAAAGIAISLLIVLGAVLLFMTIQARLDRRDPKLALAPVTADVVTFA